MPVTCRCPGAVLSLSVAHATTGAVLALPWPWPIGLVTRHEIAVEQRGMPRLSWRRRADATHTDVLALLHRCPGALSWRAVLARLSGDAAQACLGRRPSPASATDRLRGVAYPCDCIHLKCTPRAFQNPEKRFTFGLFSKVVTICVVQRNSGRPCVLFERIVGAVGK